MAKPHTEARGSERVERGARDPHQSRAGVGILIDEGIDWLTITASHDESGRSLRSIASALVEQEVCAGHDERAAPMKRYRGFAAGAVSYGERDEDACLQVSGERAREVFPQVIGLARTVSRLDVQTTIAFEEPAIEIGPECYRQLATGTKRKGRPPTGSMIVNTQGGLTTYLGAPSSDQYVRVYDKGIESGTEAAGALWRCEAVFRRKHARAAADHIQLCDSSEAAAAQLCAGALHKKGVERFWSSAISRKQVSGAAQTTSAERKLNWLRSQVKPTVEYFRDRGELNKVLEALNLVEYL